MSSSAASKLTTELPFPATLIERLAAIRQIVADEGHALIATSKSLSPQAVTAAEMTANCQGNVVVTGVGKAGLVGQKLVATLASTGSPAHFLHPTEAIHGDLGRVRDNDVVWALSNSGRSEEVVQIASHLRCHSAGLIAITASDDNPLAAAADVVVAIGKHDEACVHGLAPTTSTTVMMAVGDAIAMLASRLRKFTPQDFAKFHPGGALGKKLANVHQIMRPLAQCRIADQQTTIRQAMVSQTKTGRRTGAIMLVDDNKNLCGIFTDSDLARLLESRDESALDRPIADRMTASPTTVDSDMLLQDAIAMMSKRRISELPVVDADGKPVGLVDITDVIGLADGYREEDFAKPMAVPFSPKKQTPT
ncbi:Arabinose 5-phosphate isomerase KpsF [Rubripirellula obstinata]|uniref:Arabinose 5-phosphate isomerase KpsF n=1 Tax=Rubripirellula obstinata TaxID=406547 RepID=A0A5B1CDA1_9BACT|nr:KpsF/GutQ family sugar-phosphate isomerase [Rubripirellula obstinata]KAA1258546.1 Arabinose 5-phosphate isomerase KpsF [Rubripirellula obstinata]